MPQIARESLLSLEAYSRQRSEFRAKVIAHKKHRTVHIGDHVTLIFEDELTIRYQIQEMLRIERTFEEGGIQDELDVYNPLIPDGGNFKATMMIEYLDAGERARMLARLKGVEDRVWIQADGCARIFAIADEDLARENDNKTAAVHFLRFQLDPETRKSLNYGNPLGMGVDHPAYSAMLTAVDPKVRASLVGDLA
ncbi:MAG: DUF3501 family protein [Betaproteobacteria bacterium]|nr:DUF3501 family protein [Betaproteobacteria bacterium]